MRLVIACVGDKCTAISSLAAMYICQMAAAGLTLISEAAPFIEQVLSHQPHSWVARICDWSRAVVFGFEPWNSTFSLALTLKVHARHWMSDALRICFPVSRVKRPRNMETYDCSEQTNNTNVNYVGRPTIRYYITYDSTISLKAGKVAGRVMRFTHYIKYTNYL